MFKCNLQRISFSHLQLHSPGQFWNILSPDSQFWNWKFSHYQKMPRLCRPGLLHICRSFEWKTKTKLGKKFQCLCVCLTCLYIQRHQHQIIGVKNDQSWLSCRRCRPGPLWTRRQEVALLAEEGGGHGLTWLAGWPWGCKITKSKYLWSGPHPCVWLLHSQAEETLAVAGRLGCCR